MSAPHPFHRQLADEIPALRAFARSLARDVHRADDLVQETLMKAWDKRDSYAPGTRLRAWLFTILRNAFYSEVRKRRREVEDVDGFYAARLAEKPGQEHAVALSEFAAALGALPADQREALVLVGAAGFAYEEAAEVCGCAVGTIKSRVSRARAHLAEALGLAGDDAMTGDPRMEAVVRVTLAGPS
jgi:RNA polymerase sigma-70 factor (ECF subfamily)